MLIDARLARIFCVVAEELHFGQAAKKLYMSQPPLSQAIKQLEDELEAKLFIRTTRSVRLTKAGEHLYGYLQQLGQDTQHLRTSIKHIAQGKKGVIRVGVTPSGIYSNFPTVLRFFKHHYPDIVFNVIESSTELMSAQLQRGELDISFMRPLTPKPGLQHEVMYKEPLCLALRKDHPLSNHKEICQADMANEPLITYDAAQSPYFQHLTTEWLGNSRVELNAIQDSVLPTMLALVDGGLGVAIVPSAFALNKPFGLTYIPLAQSESYLAELSLAWRKNETNALVLHVIAILRKNNYLFHQPQHFTHPKAQ